MIRDLYKLLIQKITPELAGLGFTTGRAKGFSRIQGEAFQRLGTSLREVPSERRGFVEVFPGFNYPEVESLAAELTGQKVRPGFITCSLNIGLLMPKPTSIQWPLATEADVDQLAPIILTAVREFGLPFWESYTTLQKLLEHYEADDRIVCRDEWIWKMAAAYCLLGHPSQAIHLLESKAATMPRLKASAPAAIQKIQARFRN